MNDTTMTHAAGCSKPPPEADSRGRLKCPECRWLQQPKPRPLAAPAPSRPVIEPKPKPISAYRCRDHHDQAVTFRGKGCPLCPKRTKRRKATPPSWDTEMEQHQ